METAKYYYMRNGRSYSVYEQGGGKYGDYSCKEDARRKVFELNGWKYFVTIQYSLNNEIIYQNRTTEIPNAEAGQTVCVLGVKYIVTGVNEIEDKIHIYIKNGSKSKS